jgi:hypothetical protein
MDSDLLNDLYAFIPEKFFLKKGEPRFDVYRALTRRTEYPGSVKYVTNYGNSVFDMPAIIEINSGAVLLSWRRNGKLYRGNDLVDIQEFKNRSEYWVYRGILNKNLYRVSWETHPTSRTSKYKNLVISEKYCDKIIGDKLVYTKGQTS